MLCDICKKNPATIHIQEITGSEKKTVHLCQTCAEKKVREDSSSPVNPVNLAEILFNISANFSSKLQDAEMPEKEDSEYAGIFCPVCGWDFNHLRKTGRLGCPECYKAFASYLKCAIGTMHRGTVHQGKIPPSVRNNAETGRIVRVNMLASELEKLRSAQKAAVAEEEYEQAAVLRDKIAELSKRLDALSEKKESF